MRKKEKHSLKESLFVFSTEHTDRDGFILQKTSRYAHSKDYILSIAAKSGFQLEYFAQSNLRKDKKNETIIGFLSFISFVVFAQQAQSKLFFYLYFNMVLALCPI